MATKTPNALSMDWLKENGYTAQKVEFWNSFARRRIDFFNCIDIIAIRPGEILGVQATTYSNIWSHKEKIINNPKMVAWLKAGGKLSIFGWKGNELIREDFSIMNII